MNVIIENSKHEGLFHIWCDGCSESHIIWNKDCKAYPNGWIFNNDLIRPTFIPSLLIRSDVRRCHSFITDGNIRYLNDCTHSLAGKTIPLKYHEELNIYSEYYNRILGK